MAGQWKRGIAAGLLLAAACGYDDDYNGGTGPGAGDSTAVLRADAAPRVLAAAGDLGASLVEFRKRLGDSSNRVVGELPAGRREINWDGVSGALLNVDNFPPDQFNRVVPRGQLFRTEGTGFRVSDNALSDLNPAFAAEFAAFSPTRIFIPVGSQTMDVDFVVAGTLTPARVNGFGVVFSDVDAYGSTGLAFFDAAGRLLARVYAPTRLDANGHSFVGVTFSRPVVARVRIIAGHAPITAQAVDLSAGGVADLVAMDDFIAGEPHAIQ